MVRLEALEVALELVCTGSGAAELADAVRAAWDWCVVEDAATTPRRVTVLLEDDPDALAASAVGSDLFGSDLRTVMDRLSPVVTRLAVTDRSLDLTMFHACAVADPATGATAVLVGPSGTGKTTLARALCTDLTYLSDETAGVTRDHRVVPYPKPLSILETPGAELKDQVSPGRLGLRPLGIGPYRLTALLQLRRDPAHLGDPVLEPLLTIDALPTLVEQTSFTRAMDHPLRRLAEIAAHVGGVRRVTYAEAADLRPVVRRLLEGTPTDLVAATGSA